jgi:hypothetical protein
LYKFDPSLFKIELSENNRISFETKNQKLKGFQTQYRKVISIEENVLRIDYTLKNIGKKNILTEEYCHNFLSIDHQDLSDDYILEFNFELNPLQFAKVVDPNNNLIVGKSCIGWNGKPVSDIFIAELNGKTPLQASWRLINNRLKVGVSEEVNFKSSKVNLWGNGHVVSPELFFKTEICPGKEVCWHRRYTFFKL